MLCNCFSVVAYLFLFRLEELGVKEVMKYIKNQSLRKMFLVSLFLKCYFLQLIFYSNFYLSFSVSERWPSSEHIMLCMVFSIDLYLTVFYYSILHLMLSDDCSFWISYWMTRISTHGWKMSGTSCMIQNLSNLLYYSHCWSN